MRGATRYNDIIKTFIKDKLNITILNCDIDRCHRLGGAGGPIIIKFARHNIKSLVYKNKKKLKGSEYLITESLTKTCKYCLRQLKELRKSGVISSYWTLDGEIYYIHSNNNNKKIHLKSPNVEDIEVVEIKRQWLFRRRRKFALGIYFAVIIHVCLYSQICNYRISDSVV